MKRTPRSRRRAQREQNLPPLSAERAFSDALHSPLVDLAYEMMKDPEYQKILDEFLRKTFAFLSRPPNGQK